MTLSVPTGHRVFWTLAVLVGTGVGCGVVYYLVQTVSSPRAAHAGELEPQEDEAATAAAAWHSRGCNRLCNAFAESGKTVKMGAYLTSPAHHYP